MSLVARNNVFELDRFFSDYRVPAAASQRGSFFAPRVDISELNDHYLIAAELPGVSKEDINVHVKEGILTLEAESKSESGEEVQGKMIRRERRTGKFKRTFNLGTEVSEADIKATFENGILQLRAPKLVEQPVEQRRIDIS